MLTPKLCCFCSASSNPTPKKNSPSPRPPRASVTKRREAEKTGPWSRSRDEGARGSGKVFVSAGLAACASEFATLPLDTAKVRLQLQSLSETYKPRKYRGVSHAMRLMVRQEGLGSLWNGLIPGLHRQALFTTIRLGLYDTLKVHAAAEGGGGEATLGGRVSLAVLTSALGIAAANPSDVLKVRCQAHGLRGGAMRNYRHIVSTEGLRGGLYKGFTANLIRNSVISASEIISYEQAKKTLIRVGGVADDWRLHLASGCIAGLVATVLGSPPDILATKAMQKQGRYGGLRASEIAVKMVKTEGFLAFYKGFWPNFLRVGSFNITMWFLYEQMKRLMDEKVPRA